MNLTRIFLIIAILAVLLAVALPAMRVASKQQEPEVQPMNIPQDTSQRFQFKPIDQSLLKELNAQERQVIINKGTERAYVGEFTDNKEEGTYYCRQCGSPLYASDDKFNSNCGWPSFDEELPFAVVRHPDADGSRTEIVCATCNGHLGHVFLGERFTEKNTRHCVNSISMTFKEGAPQARAVFAGGCFWGVEHLFESVEGVYEATSGYTGGKVENPTYEDVLSKKSGHLEAVEILYNPKVVSYEELAKYFFEIHDPTQANGQGPDIGNQYLSAIFYQSRHEFDTAVKLINTLEDKGLKIATTLRPAAKFWDAEGYHQDYYERKGSQPYCHAWTKRF